MSEHTTNKPRPIPSHEMSDSGRRAMLAGIGGLAAGALLTGRAQAGPLDPPPGPIAPTGKPLTEVEPRVAINATNTPGDATSRFRITQPGSYYLTGNITGLVGQHGISVAASGVTIDLNGFLLRGLGSLHGNFDGINTEGIQSRITVRNGHLASMGRAGMNLPTHSLVQDISVQFCLGTGITVGASSQLHNCLVAENSAWGIVVADSCVVRACNAAENVVDGINASTNCVIEACTASGNGQEGICADSGSIVNGCCALGNAGSGILVQASSAIQCAAWNNDADGIRAELQSTVKDCRAGANSAFGIRTSFGGAVSGCAASENSSGGISAVSDAHLSSNTCDNNGGAGISITGSDNRIDGNHCTDNPIGLLVSSGGNIIIRNTCAGNTVVNWSLSINNHYGPIVNRVGVGTGAVSGNFAPSSLESTDPHANFTY